MSRKRGNSNRDTSYSPAVSEYEAAPGVSEAPAFPLHISLTVGADGRVLIPLEMRRSMLIGADGKVTAHLADGELRLISPAMALKHLQDLVVRQDTGAGSVVDELLADRRREEAQT